MHGGVAVRGGATFVLSGRNSVITRNVQPSGGGVHLVGGCGFAPLFIMSAGAIRGNVANNTGGGVYVGGGVFQLEGGTIDNNRATTGGGLSIANRANVSMVMRDNALIAYNTATAFGGGVFISGGGHLSLARGTIRHNTAAHGGGVFQSYNSNFTMSGAGGTISSNRASVNGGGVTLNRGAVFSLSGGNILTNTATQWGGGVVLSQGTRMTMSAGLISGNRAGSGNGIWTDTSTTFTRTGHGGTINDTIVRR